MKINLVTDAKYHNLVLMKLSAYHKMLGDEVYLNGVGYFDYTYGSWLFDWSQKQPTDCEGGPGIDPMIRLDNFKESSPRDYKLFNLNYSLGYTWSYCPRKCEFCVVPDQNNPKEHHSIWEFHNSKFKEICLLNNNTFSDPQWEETFQEIWDADLIVRDENGYDLRLLDNEKARALKKTKFKDNLIHFSWDLMVDEGKILEGFDILKEHKLNRHDSIVYVLVGYNTTDAEDFYRIQKIHDNNMSPYVMPFEKHNRHLYALKRFIDQRCYRHSPTIKDAWNSYIYKE